MSYQNLSLNKLEQVISLRKKIEKLKKQLNTLLGGSSAPTASTGRRRGGISAAGRARIAAAQRARWAKARGSAKPKAAGKPRGRTGDRILKALKAAGATGISVQDLARKIKVPNPNVHVWFATTGKKVANIKKIGRGQFAWAE